jgi:hypothetical protein
MAKNPIAYSILPSRFEDGRHTAIENGARKIGYSIIHTSWHTKFPFKVQEDDILLTWTVHRGPKESIAKQFEALGGRVVVCEEAYFRVVNSEKCFALALHDHCGAGTWNCGDASRWDSFDIHVQPWRPDDPNRYILVSEQRGIGSSSMASPINWHLTVSDQISKITDRRVVVRYHPKTRINQAHVVRQSTEQTQLEGAHAVVTWSSALAVHALVAGIPVFYQAPHFIAAPACLNNLNLIETPHMNDTARLAALRDLAWAQWRRSEIENGEALSHLLRRPE